MRDLGHSACGQRLFPFIPWFQLSVFKINSDVGFSLLCFSLSLPCVVLPLIKLMSLEVALVFFLVLFLLTFRQFSVPQQCPVPGFVPC